MKANQQVQPIIADDFKSVSFTINDGGEPLVLDMTKLHPDILARAAAVGMAQVRIVDAAAISATDKEGNILSAAERMRIKRENMAALISHYETGTAEWSRVGQGGGGKSLTVEAIAALNFSGDYEKAEASVAKLAGEKFGGDTKKCLAFLRTGAKVSAKMEEMRKARMPAPKIDADAALDALTAE